MPLEQQLDLVMEAFTGRGVAEALLATASEIGATAVVVDANLGGALAAAETLACPTAVLLHSMWATHVDVWFGPLWPFFEGAINATRAELDLPPAQSWTGVFASHDRLIAPVPASFDAPASMEPPSSLRYAGFLTAEAERTTAAFPAGTGPRVVVGLSTTEMGQQPLLERIIEALAGLSVRAVVTTAGRAEITDAPSHVSVVDYAPHGSLLREADLMVSHAGLGSVAAALSVGVPMVCTPIDRDQPLNAERVTAAGAGVTVAGEISASTIAEAVTRVLEERTFSVRAKAIARASAAAGGASGATADLERLADAPR